MTEETTPAPTRQKFASPLQKAQAGKIGGGKDQSSQAGEQSDTKTLERQNVSESLAAPAAKVRREDTHFRQTVWMPKPLNRRLKVHVAKIGDDISGLINRLVEKYLNEVED